MKLVMLKFWLLLISRLKVDQVLIGSDFFNL